MQRVTPLQLSYLSKRAPLVTIPAARAVSRQRGQAGRGAGFWSDCSLGFDGAGSSRSWRSWDYARCEATHDVLASQESMRATRRLADRESVLRASRHWSGVFVGPGRLAAAR